MAPLPGDWLIPRRLICVGTENECNDTKWMAMGWRPTKEMLNLDTQWPFRFAGKKTFTENPKVKAASIVIYRATQYKVCVYLCVATCVSVLLRACISLVLPPVMWPAVDSCACAWGWGAAAVAGLVLSGVGGCSAGMPGYTICLAAEWLLVRCHLLLLKLHCQFWSCVCYTDEGDSLLVMEMLESLIVVIGLQLLKQNWGGVQVNCALDFQDVLQI